MEDKIIYYSDELNDDFSGIKRDDPIIDSKFPFIHKNIFWNFLAILLYRVIVFPYDFIYMKLKFHHKTIGKEKLKGYRGKYFIYGNHTQVPGDGFVGPKFIFPRKPYTVVSPANIALKGTRNFMMMLGAIPVPNDIHALRKFEEALKYYNDKHHPIIIYPEAHIWPYYTKIRNFKSVSFRYPLKNDAKVFCFTNVYQKRRHSLKPKMITYIDGPFEVNKELDFKNQVEDLRNQVYNQMVERAKLSTYEYKYHYVRKETSDELQKD